MLLIFAGGAVSASAVVELPARVRVIHPEVAEAVYEGVDYGQAATPQDDRLTRTTWRVVEHTGNCCEHDLTTTPDGRLLDFGGMYATYSDDRGQSWRQVEPLTPLIGGEGAIVPAPGGDVLGVTWDLNGADQLQSFKYEADTQQWLYTHMPLHGPFFDREWIGVVPGPVTVDGETHEYLSFIKGGAYLKEPWFYSTDGLNYLPAPSPELGQMLGEVVASSPLPTSPDPLLDWAQPNTSSGMTVLGGGRMLAAPDWFLESLVGDEALSYGLLDGETFTWSPYAFPDGSELTGRYRVDSAGRLHNVMPSPDRTGFAYRVSDDGGETWESVDVLLPPSHTMDGAGQTGGRQSWDFRANRAAGLAAVAIRAQDATTGTGRDLVYTFDITDEAPTLSRLLRVGLGDLAAGSGTSSSGARMDYGSVSIFDDGRIAVSFLDSTTTYCVCNLKAFDPNNVHPNGWMAPGPAIAIEGETAFS